MFCQPKKYYEYYKCPIIKTCPPSKPRIVGPPVGGNFSSPTPVSYKPTLHPSPTPVSYKPTLHPSPTPVSYKPTLHPSPTPVSYKPTLHPSPTPVSYKPTLHPSPTPSIETTIIIPRGNNGYGITRKTINDNIPLVSFVFSIKNDEKNKENKINFLKNNKLTEISFDIDRYQNPNPNPNIINYDFYYQERENTDPQKLGSVVLTKDKSFPEKVTLSNLNLNITPSIGDYLNWYPRIYISSPDATSISINASPPYYNYPDNKAGVKGRCILYTSGYNSCTAFQATGILKFKGSG